MRTRFAVHALTLLALLTSTIAAAAAFDPNAFEQVILEEMRATGTPGVAVVVVAEGKVVLERGFGVESVETRRPVSSESLFRLGSSTKMFVGIASMRLANDARLDLETPIRAYAPELHSSIGRLTMHQLLSHTAGLRDDARMDGPLEESALETRILAMGPEAFFTEPGKIMSYANPGYAIAGYVIQRITAKPFRVAIDELVLAPLRMSSSSFRPMDAMTRPLAVGHDPGREGATVRRPFAENAANWPPGSLFTNAIDVAHFLEALVATGVGGETPIAKAVLRASQPRARILALDRDYGYGFDLRAERGVRIIGHTGARAGYGSIVWAAPSRGFAVAILANRSGAIFFGAARKALELALDPPVDSNKPAIPAATLPLSNDEMNRLAGEYVNNEQMRTRLLVREGKLLITIPGREVEVQKVATNRYRAQGAGPLTEFLIATGQDGRPEYLYAEVWAARRTSS